MKKLTILAVAVALVSTSSVVKADMLYGTISFNGVANFNAVPTSATQITSYQNSPAPYVASTGGEFFDVPLNTSANLFAPYILNTSTPVSSFLQFDGMTFSMTSSSSQVLGPFLFTTAYGTLTGPGFDATPYIMTLAASGPQTTSFQASLAVNYTALPDGGTTLALLGGALTVVGLIRRKLVA